MLFNKKFYLILVIVFLVPSCGKAPSCKFNGEFVSEANAGCLVIDNGKVLVVQDSKGRLALPGGGKSSGEAPQCTAEREVWEETGIEVVAKNKIITFENGFQLFSCQALEEQVMDGSKRPWRLEVEAIHWLSSQDFEDKVWRFPDQVDFIRGQLESQSTEK